MTRRVLFVCIGNSARNVRSAATLRAWAGGKLEAFSAGSQPTGTINLHALTTLSNDGIAIAGLRSKS